MEVEVEGKEMEGGKESFVVFGEKKYVEGDLRDGEFQGGENESHERRSKVKKCKRWRVWFLKEVV